MSSQNLTYQVLIDSKLMQNYRVATAVSGETQLALARDKDGELQIFSIGSDGHVYNIYADQASDTGWSMVDLQLEITPESMVAGQLQDSSVLVGVADKNDITSYYYITDERWKSCWQQLIIEGNPLPRFITFGAGAFWTLEAIQYRTLHQLYPPGGTITTLHSNVKSLTDYDIGQTINGTTLFISGKVRSGPVGTPWNLGFYTLDLQGNVLSSYPGEFTQIAVTTNATGLSECFLLQKSDAAIYYVQQSDQSQGQLSIKKISGNIQVTDIQASTNAEGLLEVFAIGADGYLYHLRQEANDTEAIPLSPSWTEMFQIYGELQFAHFIVGKNRDGISEVYAVTGSANFAGDADKLMRIWQDTGTTDWKYDRVEVQSTGNVEEIKVYMTEITVVDEKGITHPDTTVTLRSSDPTAAIVNGRALYLDPVTPVTCQSDAAGTVTVLVETNSIDAPILKIATEFMQDSECITVEPNAYIQEKLLTVSAAELRQPTNVFSGDQTSLLQGDFDTDDVAGALADALNRCMALAAKPANPGPPENLKYLADINSPKGLRYVEHDDGTFPTRIDLASVEEQCWKIDFSSGLPVFTSLTCEEATSFMKSRTATLPAASGVFDVDWGDIWDEVTEAVTEIVDVVVTTVVDAASKVVTEIRAQIALLIDGIKHVFDTAIDLVEQAFDMAEGLLKKVGAAFEQFFNWMAFLFKWQDILRTHEALVYLFNQTLPVVKQAAENVRQQIQLSLQQLEGKVGDYIDNLIENVLGGRDSTILQLQQQNAQPSKAARSAAGVNLFRSGFMHNLDKVKVIPDASAGVAAAVLPDPVTAAIDSLINNLLDQMRSKESDEAFVNAIEYLKRIGSNPDQFLQLALGAFLDLMKGVALVGLNVIEALLDAIFAVIEAIIDLLFKLLNEKWQVPLVTDLYAFITRSKAHPKGAPLTALDLAAMIIAVPTTVIYKNIFKAAPFPDSIEENFTTAWLLEVTGLGGPSLATSAGPGDGDMIVSQGAPPRWRQYLGLGTMAGYATSYISLGEYERRLDSMPPKVPPPEALTRQALITEWLTWVFSCPWALDPSNNAKPGINNSTEAGNLIWMPAILIPSLDTVMYFYSKAKSPLGGVMLRNFNDLAVLADWAVACRYLAATGWWAFVDKNKHKLALTQNFFTTIPGAFKVLRVSKIVESTDGLSPLALGVLDFTGDVGAGFIEYKMMTDLA